MSDSAHRSGELYWVERARRMVDYYPEASAFIRRASEHFPVTAEYTQHLLHLWVETDVLDGLILPALNELNSELLMGHGTLDTTRGVSMRQSDIGGYGESDETEVVFEFTWSLSWADEREVSVILSSNISGMVHIEARGIASSCQRRIGYPATRSALEEALIAVYVAEETSPLLDWT